ncbi:MAG: SDR family NAD(P)-dependent oxidoreductase, partial [Leucobacter sp.]
MTSIEPIPAKALPSREHPLAGTVALVTGGARGIGRGIVERLASDGAAVMIGYASRASDERVQELVESIEAAGGQAASYRGDLGEPEVAAELIHAVREKFGRLDSLVNNAAVSDYRPFG